MAIGTKIGKIFFAFLHVSWFPDSEKPKKKIVMSSVESKNSESTLLFCVYYSSTLQGR